MTTLRGRIAYANSGQTKAEWRVIEDAMSRCIAPDFSKTKRKTEPPIRATSDAKRLKVSIERDLAHQQLKLDVQGEQQRLKAEAAARRTGAIR